MEFITAAARNRTDPQHVRTRLDRRTRPGFDRLSTWRAHPVTLDQYSRGCPRLYKIFRRPLELAYWASVMNDLDYSPAIREYAALAVKEIQAAIA